MKKNKKNLIQVYAQRKVKVESVFGHIKGNRSFRRFSLRGLDKVYVEFGVVALAHNILKVAGIRQLLSEKNRKKQKGKGEKRSFFSLALFFRAYRTALQFAVSDFLIKAITIKDGVLHHNVIYVADCI